MYISIMSFLYASERVKPTLRHRFKMLDKKPCPWRQSYIGPDMYKLLFYEVAYYFQLHGMALNKDIHTSISW